MSFTYTTDEELEEIMDKDQTVEVIGYIESLIAPTQVGQGHKKYHLFKIILSNGSKKITILIWGSELIEKYQEEMMMNRIVHLEKATAKLANMKYQKNDKMIPFELIINNATIIEFLGIHGESISQKIVAVKEVDFLGTVGVTGPVVIQGYLKTAFSLITHKNGTMTWGNGAITDGTYKINIHIANFVSSDIKKGTKIELTGEIKSLEPPTTIHCVDMKSIKVLLTENPMPIEKLIHGVRTPRRPLSEKNNEEIDQSPNKIVRANTKSSIDLSDLKM